MKSANLVTRFNHHFLSGDVSQAINWEFDSDGYPLSATIAGENESDVWLFEY